MSRGLFAVAVLSAIALAAAACQPTPRFDYDFEDEGILDQLEWKCRTQYRISPEHASSGSRSLELSLYPAPADEPESYPGVSFTKFDPDWSRFRTLVFDAHNPEESALQLAVRIDDRDAPDYSERYNQAFTLAPGDNRVSIPLADLVTSGTKRRLDSRGISTVILFLVQPKESHTLYLDRVRLE